MFPKKRNGYADMATHPRPCRLPPEQGKLAAHAVLVEEVGKQVVLARPGEHRGDGDGRLLVAPAKLCTLVSGTDRVMGRLVTGSMTTPRP